MDSYSFQMQTVDGNFGNPLPEMLELRVTTLAGSSTPGLLASVEGPITDVTLTVHTLDMHQIWTIQAAQLVGYTSLTGEASAKKGTASLRNEWVFRVEAMSVEDQATAASVLLDFDTVQGHADMGGQMFSDPTTRPGTILRFDSGDLEVTDYSWGYSRNGGSVVLPWPEPRELQVHSSTSIGIPGLLYLAATETPVESLSLIATLNNKPGSREELVQTWNGAVIGSVRVEQTSEEGGPQVVFTLAPVENGGSISTAFDAEGQDSVVANWDLESAEFTSPPGFGGGVATCRNGNSCILLELADGTTLPVDSYSLQSQESTDLSGNALPEFRELRVTTPAGASTPALFAANGDGWIGDATLHVTTLETQQTWTMENLRLVEYVSLGGEAPSKVTAAPYDELVFRFSVLSVLDETAQTSVLLDLDTVQGHADMGGQVFSDPTTRPGTILRFDSGDLEVTDYSWGYSRNGGSVVLPLPEPRELQVYSPTATAIPGLLYLAATETPVESLSLIATLNNKPGSREELVQTWNGAVVRSVRVEQTSEEGGLQVAFTLAPAENGGSISSAFDAEGQDSVVASWDLESAEFTGPPGFGGGVATCRNGNSCILLELADGTTLPVDSYSLQSQESTDLSGNALPEFRELRVTTPAGASTPALFAANGDGWIGDATLLVTTLETQQTWTMENLRLVEYVSLVGEMPSKVTAAPYDELVFRFGVLSVVDETAQTSVLLDFDTVQGHADVGGQVFSDPTTRPGTICASTAVI